MRRMPFGCAVVVACSSTAERADPSVDVDLPPDTTEQTPIEESPPVTGVSPIDGAWAGACDGEVFPAGTTTYGSYEATVLMCFFDLVEDPLGVVNGGFRYELWYSFSDWEYLMGAGDLVLGGTLVGDDVILDISRGAGTPSTYGALGRFELVLADDTLEGELHFSDLSEVARTNVCSFARAD